MSTELENRLATVERELQSLKESAIQEVGFEAARFQNDGQLVDIAFNQSGMLRLAEECVYLARTGNRHAFIDDGSFVGISGCPARITHDLHVGES